MHSSAIVLSLGSRHCEHLLIKLLAPGPFVNRLQSSKLARFIGLTLEWDDFSNGNKYLKNSLAT
jgi:hypothetical protein